MTLPFPIVIKASLTRQTVVDGVRNQFVELRRLSIQSDTSYEDVVEKIKTAFRLTSEVQLSYTDSDNDSVTMSDQNDWADAIQTITRRHRLTNFPMILRLGVSLPSPEYQGTMNTQNERVLQADSLEAAVVSDLEDVKERLYLLEAQVSEIASRQIAETIDQQTAELSLNTPLSSTAKTPFYANGKDALPVQPLAHSESARGCQAYRRYRRRSRRRYINRYSTHKCDACHLGIVGTRYSCPSCPDFDLCELCYPNVNHVHPLANFKSSNPDEQKPETPVPETSHSDIICDHCRENIIGIRYKCGHCLDFDLCARCENIEPPVHDSNHLFIKIRKPLVASLSAPLLPQLTMHHSLGIPVLASPPPSKSEAVTASLLNAPVEESTILPSAVFIRDVTLEDGTEVKPGQHLSKIWLVKNTGPIDWPEGSYLGYDGGHSTRDNVKDPILPVAKRGQKVFVIAEIDAPTTPGQYTTYFRMFTKDMIPFGHRLWCKYTVVDQPMEEPHLAKSGEMSSMNSSSMIYPSIPAESVTRKTKDDSDSEGDDQDPFRDTGAMNSLSSSVLERPDSLSSSHPSVESLPSAPGNEPRHVQEEPANVGHPASDVSSSYASAENQHVHNSGSSSLSRKSVDLQDNGFVLVSNTTENPTVAEQSNSQDTTIYPELYNPNEKSPRSSVFSITRNTAPAPEEHPYQRQLDQLNEMGLLDNIQLAIKILAKHNGNLDMAVEEILQSLYPDYYS